MCKQIIMMIKYELLIENIIVYALLLLNRDIWRCKRMIIITL